MFPGDYWCFGETYTLVARNHNSDGSVEVLKGSRQGHYKTLRSASDTPIIITNKTYNDQFSYGALYGETDYFPQQSSDSAKTVLNRHAYMDGHQIKFSQHSKPNQLIYVVNAKKAGLVDLPALVYSHSLVKVNNNRQAVKASSRGTLLVHVRQGRNLVSFTYKPAMVYYLLMIVAAIAWVGLAYGGYHNKAKKEKPLYS